MFFVTVTALFVTLGAYQLSKWLYRAGLAVYHAHRPPEAWTLEEIMRNEG